MNFTPKRPPPLLLSQADMLHPHAAAGGNLASTLTSGKPRRSASRADLAPQPLRRGADIAVHAPSRVGDRLHYRDGSITDMQGHPIAQAPKQPNPRRNVNRKL